MLLTILFRIWQYYTQIKTQVCVFRSSKINGYFNFIYFDTQRYQEHFAASYGLNVYYILII